ncbi:calcium-binding and coiled-coil domain-containing protein 2 isoform X2 [Brachyistius frenatus]|uniref:calcium-binding and coiled-coil domain-containing protein 2 isoform X2 n=1 Tax=Brachyistius frenatus TaxID=100188 RepID=UPI0037E8D7CD
MSEEHLKAAQSVTERWTGWDRVDLGAATTDSRLQLSMEAPTEAAAAADPAASTFSQVVFVDIPYSYPPSTPVTVCYTLSAAFQPSSRDWVGIFKVGWSTTKDYHTFVWVEPCVDVEGQQSVKKQAVFMDYYLPKDEIEFYQFCYVDRSGQVRGASTPFCFRNTAEQSLEGSLADDLMVITTQDKVDQSDQEKSELQRELDLMRDENKTLKSSLQEAAGLKEQSERGKVERTQLLREMDQLKEQCKNLQSNVQVQVQENDRLKGELVVQMTKQMEIQQKNQSLNSDAAPKPNEEKYNRAVKKINQLKEECKELRGKVDVQSEEINRLNAKLREGERELLKTRDNIQLLQVDLQSSEAKTERQAAELQRFQSLSHSLDNVKTENQQLRERLSRQEMLQDSSDDNLKVQCETLVRQLQDAQAKLQDAQAKLQDTQAKLSAQMEVSGRTTRCGAFLERELEESREQLKSVVMMFEQEQQKSSKYELQFKELVELMADKDIKLEENEQLITLAKKEEEELARENQRLRGELEGTRRVYSNIHLASADSLHEQPDEQRETTGQDEHLYERIASLTETQEEEEEEEESLVCNLCNEGFPGITRRELKLHELSHQVCPVCSMICDHLEQTVFGDHVYSHEM